MKWMSCFIATSLFIFSSASQSQKYTADNLASVSVFSVGLNGFVAKKLPEQLIYEEIKKDSDAITIFENILTSPHSTPASKAYAACGLWEKGATNKIHLDDAYAKQAVSVLRGDVLSKYRLKDIVFGIKLHGCK